MQTKDECPYVGVDISSLQSISDEALLFSKIDFLYCRAYGRDHTGTGDSKLADYVAAARRNNCPVGAYYFGFPFVDAAAGVSTDAEITANAEVQAQQFIDKLYAVFGTGNVGDLTPILDFEQYTDSTTQYGHTATGNAYYPQAVMTDDQAMVWLLAFKNYFNNATGKRLGIYTNDYWITYQGAQDALGLSTAQLQSINTVDDPMTLWVSRYDEWNGGATGNTTVPDFGNWTEFAAWQYTASGVSAASYGIYHSQDQLDMNRASDLNMLYVQDVIVEAPPDDPVGVVLPWDEMVKQINMNTGFFETSKYTVDEQMYVTSGNHDDAGASFGNLQYNYGTADRAQELWKYMVDNHYSVLQAAFGTYTAEFNEFVNVTNTYTRQQRIDWAGQPHITDYSLPADGHALLDPWKSCFGNALMTDECQAKYFQMMDAYYMPNALHAFKQLSCTSRAALASLFDLSVNRGRFFPLNTLVVDFEEIEARTDWNNTKKEAEKIRMINLRGNDKTNGTSGQTAIDFTPRRECQANQGGDYHGDLYDPEVQFNITQDPAIAEKAGSIPFNIKLGTIDVNDLFLGTTPITKLYLGTTLLGGSSGATYTPSSRVPDTRFRTVLNGYTSVSGSVTLTSGQPLFVDVWNWTACKTYYTIDGTTPTTASTLYQEQLTFTQSCTLKTLTVSVDGIAGAVQTLTVTVTAGAPVTSINPATVAQNTIPITVTLTNNEAGSTIYYKIGTGTTVYTYTGPFTVNQTHPDVQSALIKVSYWSVGANGTELERSIQYDTTGAIPAQSTLTATAGAGQVSLSWTATGNTTSYSVYRSTTAGTLGTVIPTAQYITATSFVDTGLTAGTTYYYTVKSLNYQNATDSVQKSATPTAALTGWRYLKIQGYGAMETGQEVTSRIVEVEAWEGSTNRMTAATVLSNDPISAGSTDINTIKDGSKTGASNTYPLWWTATPNANIVVDLGAQRALTKLSYYGYSLSGVQRTNRFKILASNTNNGTDWVTLWDMSANTVLQPILPGGYEKIL